MQDFNSLDTCLQTVCMAIMHVFSAHWVWNDSYALLCSSQISSEQIQPYTFVGDGGGGGYYVYLSGSQHVWNNFCAFQLEAICWLSGPPELIIHLLCTALVHNIYKRGFKKAIRGMCNVLHDGWTERTRSLFVPNMEGQMTLLPLSATASSMKYECGKYAVH